MTVRQMLVRLQWAANHLEAVSASDVDQATAWHVTEALRHTHLAQDRLRGEDQS